MLVERVRDALAGQGAVREQKMFGGVAFMLDEQMVVSVGKTGDLLVRADPARNAELTARPGARQADMAGRDMGPSWLLVDAPADPLDFWIGVALEYRRR